jgi:hypothetical protein
MKLLNSSKSCQFLHDLLKNRRIVCVHSVLSPNIVSELADENPVSSNYCIIVFAVRFEQVEVLVEISYVFPIRDCYLCMHCYRKILELIQNQGIQKGLEAA